MEARTVASYCTTFLKPEMLHVYRQVTGLQRYRTFVMTRALQDADRFPFPDVEILPRPHMNLFRHGYLKFIEKRPPVIYRGEYQMLSSLLEGRGADLMHIYFGHTGVHLLPFIEVWNKPCVVSFHGADVAVKKDVPDYAAKLARLFKAATLVFARSESLAARLRQFGCAEEKLRINRTGVPLHRFPFRERTPAEAGQWKIVQACRLIPKKGLVTALKAFARVLARHPQVHFCIAGKGPMQRELEELCDRLGIAEHVTFAGFLSQEDLCELYHESHLFLHPSEMQPDQDQEGVPNSMLEAMATGLPVVATRHGGIPEAVEHGETGLLVEERNEVALADAITTLLESTELQRSLGRAASHSVAHQFEQQTQIARLESFYDEAIARGAEQPATEPVSTFPGLSLQGQTALK